MEAQDHILIVDDDAEIRSLLGNYLRKKGYRASVAADGKAMWTALARGKVDLKDPATTLELLKLDAVVGLTGIFDNRGRLSSMGCGKRDRLFTQMTRSSAW